MFENLLEIKVNLKKISLNVNVNPLKSTELANGQHFFSQQNMPEIFDIIIVTGFQF